MQWSLALYWETLKSYVKSQDVKMDDIVGKTVKFDGGRMKGTVRAISVNGKVAFVEELTKKEIYPVRIEALEVVDE